ncbi:MAG: lipid II flippase MurJ, partial [Pseudomonadota bacterium]
AAAAHGVVQFNLIVGSALAASLAAGAGSQLYYADRINQLPLGVVGVAIATALLPKLAASLRGGRAAEAVETQSRAFEATLFLGLPAATALAIAAETLVAGLFQRGGFAAADAAATGQALAMYAIGLPAMLLAKVLQTALFSREQPGAAFKASLISVGTNIAAAFALIGPLGHVGLALAVTLGAWANAVALAVLLWRADALGVDDGFRRRWPRIAAATAVMGAAVYGVDLALAGFAETELERLVRLFAVVATGGAVYATAALLLRAVAPADLKAWLRRR